MLQKSVSQNQIEKVTFVDNHKRKKFRQNILLLYLMNLFGSIHFFGSVLIPFFEDYGGLNFIQTMILESIFMGGIFLMEIPTGTIADKVSRKISMNLGYLVNIIAIFVYVSKPGFLMFAIGEIIWAISVALHSGANNAFLYDTLVELGEEKSSQKHFSRMQSIGLVSISLGSISGSFIAKYIGLRATMLYSAIPLVVSFLISLKLKEPQTHDTNKNKNAWQIFRKGFNHIKKSKSLKRIIMDMVILGTLGYFGIWLYQKRLMSLGFDIKYFGFVQTSMILLQVLILNISKRIEKLLKSKKKVLSIHSILVGTGFLLTGLSKNIALNIIGFNLIVGFGMTYRILSTNYMNKHIPSAERATILSTAGMFRQFSIMMFNPLLGVGGDRNLSLMLVILGSLGAGWALISPVKEHDLLD